MPCNFWNQGLHQGATLSLDAEENIADVFWLPLLVCIAGSCSCSWRSS
jgi:heme exporter protein C